jgi:hypothetical protein
MSSDAVTALIKRATQSLDELALTVSNAPLFKFGTVSTQGIYVHGVGLIDVAAVGGSRDTRRFTVCEQRRTRRCYLHARRLRL